MEILKTNRLCFAYIKKPLLLYNLNLNFSGGVMWLFGAKESGKTTLLEVFCGMKNMYMGEVLVCGKPPKESTNNISYLPETLVALNNKSVQKNLEFAANAAGVGLDKIDYTDPFIAEYKNTKIKKLSAYNKAVFAIKRAALKNAKLLLIDINIDGFTEDEIKNYANMLLELAKNAENRQIILSCNAKTYKKLQLDLPNAKYAYLFGELYLYDNLQKYTQNVKYLDMAEYTYDYCYTATITSSMNGYILNLQGKNIKIESSAVEPIKTYFEVEDTAQVAVVASSDITSLTESELQEQLNNKRLLVFDSLSRERLI